MAGNHLANVHARTQLAAQFAHDDSARQADVRRKAYSGFISAVSEYQNDLLREVDNLDEPSKPTAAQIREITADSARLLTVWAEVRLVSGAKVGVLATEVREALDAVFSLDPVTKDEIRHIAEKDSEDKLNSFLFAAREELNG